MPNLLFVALLSLLSSAIPVDQWTCSNDVEIWCGEGACKARPEGETTPMAVTASVDGAFSVCAYSGCWEGEAKVTDAGDTRIWSAKAVPFSTNPAGDFKTDVTLLIIPADGVGFVRAGGIATPLICAPAEALKPAAHQ